MHILIRERINVWFNLLISRVCVTISDWWLEDHYSFIRRSISWNKVPHQPDVSWQCKQQLVALDRFTAGHNVKSMGFRKASLIKKSWYEWNLTLRFVTLHNIHFNLQLSLKVCLCFRNKKQNHITYTMHIAIYQSYSTNLWRIGPLTDYPMGAVTVFLIVQFWFEMYRFISFSFCAQLQFRAYHMTSLTISQHSFTQCLGAVRPFKLSGYHWRVWIVHSKSRINKL